MKKIYVVALNIGYWIFFILLLSLLYSASQINSTSGPTLIDLFKLVIGYILIPSIASFYGAYFILFRQFIQKTRIQKLIVFALAIVLVSSVVALLNIFSSVNSPRVYLEAGLLSFSLNSFHVLIGFILHSFISWFTDLKEKEALSEKTRMLEHEMLKLKLDPHFLFNTINNIDVLIETDALKASEYINKLSSILRFYLYKTSNSLIKLSEEITYIKEYIDLQKIRTSNEHFVSFSLEGKPEDYEISPMIFIPFIENAFKHSKNKKLDTIDIRMSVSESEVHFWCKNRFYKTDKTEIGIGNMLIESRLKLIYGDNYKMHSAISEDEYTVSLSIPL